MNPNDQRVRASLSCDGGAGFLIRWRGRQEGPFELDMIKAKLHAKHIGLLHEVSRDGQWITLREFLAEQERSAPTFVEQPASDSRRTVGDELILKAKATGCPTPEYQWMEVDLMTKEVVPLPNKTGVDLVVDTKTFGVRRYQLRASNSSGECLSAVAKVEVNPKAAIATPPQWNRSPEPTPNNPLILKTPSKTKVKEVPRKKDWRDSYRAPVEPGSRFGKTLPWIAVMVGISLFVYFLFNYLAGRDSYKITSKTPPSGWSLYPIGSVKTNDESFTLGTNSPNIVQQWFKPRVRNTVFTLTAVVPKFQANKESFLFAGTTNLSIATSDKPSPTNWETTLIDLPNDSISRGIMIRSFADATNSNARFLFVGFSGGSIVVSQRDEVRGKRKDNNVGNFKGIQTLSLRFIEREGDTCDAQYKLKGRDWTLITNTFKLSGSPLIGVAIASRNESNAGTFTGRFAFNGNLTTSTSTTAATNVPPKQGLLASVKDKLRNAFKGSAPTSAPKGSSTSIVSTVTVVAATNQEVVPSGSIETEPKTTPPTEPPKPAEGGSKTLPEGWVVTGIGGLTNINVTYLEKGGAPYTILANMELTTGKSKGFTAEGDVCLFVHKEFSYLKGFDFLTAPIYLTNWVSNWLAPGNIRGIMARSSLEPTANFLFIGISGANIVVYQRKDGAVTNKKIPNAADLGILSLYLSGNSTAVEAKCTLKNSLTPVLAPDIFFLPQSEAKYIGWAIMTEGGAERVTARFTIPKRIPSKKYPPSTTHDDF